MWSADFLRWFPKGGCLFRHISSSLGLADASRANEVYPADLRWEEKTVPTRSNCFETKSVLFHTPDTKHLARMAAFLTALCFCRGFITFQV